MHTSKPELTDPEILDEYILGYAKYLTEGQKERLRELGLNI